MPRPSHTAERSQTLAFRQHSTTTKKHQTHRTLQLCPRLHLNANSRFQIHHYGIHSNNTAIILLSPSHKMPPVPARTPHPPKASPPVTPCYIKTISYPIQRYKQFRQCHPLMGPAQPTKLKLLTITRLLFHHPRPVTPGEVIVVTIIQDKTLTIIVPGPAELRTHFSMKAITRKRARNANKV